MFLHFSWKYVENEMIPAAAQKAFYNCASCLQRNPQQKVQLYFWVLNIFDHISCVTSKCFCMI